jgi:hypothetical protein
MKDEVKGEQGLAALAFGTFQDEYEIEGRCYWETGSSLRSHTGNLRECMKLKEVVGIAMECAVYLTFTMFFVDFG